jgi:hypothetical protein
MQPPLHPAASQGRSAAGTGEGEAGAATFRCHGDTGLRDQASWFTNGWDASAFASCRHVVPRALGGNGPAADMPPHRVCAAVGQARSGRISKPSWHSVAASVAFIGKSGRGWWTFFVPTELESQDRIGSIFLEAHTSWAVLILGGGSTGPAVSLKIKSSLCSRVLSR